MWPHEIDKWLFLNPKWHLNPFLLFEPPDDKKFPFILVVTRRGFFTCFHPFSDFGGLKAFVVFFDRFPFRALFPSFFDGFATQLFSHFTFTLNRLFFATPLLRNR